MKRGVKHWWNDPDRGKAKYNTSRKAWSSATFSIKNYMD
jgi:hypothetical protein